MELMTKIAQVRARTISRLRTKKLLRGGPFWCLLERPVLLSQTDVDLVIQRTVGSVRVTGGNVRGLHPRNFFIERIA